MNLVQQQAISQQDTHYYGVVNSTIQLLVGELVRLRSVNVAQGASAFVSRFNSKLESFNKVLKYMEANQKFTEPISISLQPLIDLSKVTKSSSSALSKLNNSMKDSLGKSRTRIQLSKRSTFSRTKMHRNSFIGHSENYNLIDDDYQMSQIHNTKVQKRKLQSKIPRPSASKLKTPTKVTSSLAHVKSQPKTSVQLRSKPNSGKYTENGNFVKIVPGKLDFASSDSNYGEFDHESTSQPGSST